MSQNVELKARVENLASLANVAVAVGAEDAGHWRQIDTYFDCRFGRLKLRETDGRPAELVCYERPNRNHARISDYHLTPVSDAASLKNALTLSLGVRVVVDKTRHLFLWHNVRIHLDDVAELGTFLEFEAVLSEATDAATGRSQLRRLCDEFGIRSDAIESQSYSDLLLAMRTTTR